GNCTTNGITLSWTAPSGSWASKYDVYEGASSGSLSVIVAGTTTTSISDPASNPLNSLPRYYKVRSYDAYGAGGSNTDSSVTSITVSPCSSLILESEYPAISQQNVATGTSSGKTFSAAFTFSQAIKTTGTGTPDSTMIKLYDCNSTTTPCSSPVGTSWFGTGTFSVSGSQVTATTGVGGAPLNPNHWYLMQLFGGSGGITSSIGVTLSSNYSYNFKANSSVGSPASPVVTGSAFGTGTNSLITLNFSSQMDQTNTASAVCISTGATCTGTTFTVANGGLTGASWTGSALNTLTLTPVGLTNGTFNLTVFGTTASSCGSQSMCARDIFSIPLNQTSSANGNYTGTVGPFNGTDSTYPNNPTVTSPASEVWTSSSTYIIEGSVSSPVSETSYDVQVYQAAATNNGCTVTSVGNPASLSVVAEQTLTNGVTSFSITTPLNTAAANCFLVTATEESGNESSVPFGGIATMVPTIHQGDNKTGPGTVTPGGGASQGNGVIDITTVFNGDNGSGNTANSAVLNYGTTTAYGSSFTLTRTAPSGSGSYGQFTGAVTGLSASTTYHVRVVITDSNGFDGPNVNLCDEYPTTVKSDGSGTSTTCTISRATSAGAKDSLTVTTTTTTGAVNYINPPTAANEVASRSKQQVVITVSGTGTNGPNVQLTISTGSSPKTLPSASTCVTISGNAATFTWDGTAGNGNYVADGIYSMTATRYLYPGACLGTIGEVETGTVTVSNIASILPLDPPPGSASLQPGQTVAIVATAQNYNNNTLASGSNTSGTCASGQSKCQLMFSASPTSAGSFNAPSFGTASGAVGGVDVGQTQTNQCPTLSSGQACILYTLGNGTKTPHQIIITATATSQALNGTST